MRANRFLVALAVLCVALALGLFLTWTRLQAQRERGDALEVQLRQQLDARPGRETGFSQAPAQLAPVAVEVHAASVKSLPPDPPASGNPPKTQDLEEAIKEFQAEQLSPRTPPVSPFSAPGR